MMPALLGTGGGIRAMPFLMGVSKGLPDVGVAQSDSSVTVPSGLSGVVHQF